MFCVRLAPKELHDQRGEWNHLRKPTRRIGHSTGHFVRVSHGARLQRGSCSSLVPHCAGVSPCGHVVCKPSLSHGHYLIPIWVRNFSPDRIFQGVFLLCPSYSGGAFMLRGPLSAVCDTCRAECWQMTARGARLTQEEGTVQTAPAPLIVAGIYNSRRCWLRHRCHGRKLLVFSTLPFCTLCTQMLFVVSRCYVQR